MTETTNYGLHLTDDSSERFIDWREKLNGASNSNMVKIDTALAEKADTSHTHPTATQESDGFLSAEDKTKLDNLSTEESVNLNIGEDNIVSGVGSVAFGTENAAINGSTYKIESWLEQAEGETHATALVGYINSGHTGYGLHELTQGKTIYFSSSRGAFKPLEATIIKGYGENEQGYEYITFSKKPGAAYDIFFFITSSAAAGRNLAHGYRTLAGHKYSHAEGYTTKALADSSHAEGSLTIAAGQYSHAEGTRTRATGYCSHAEGNGCIASANESHAGGLHTNANTDYATIVGKYGTTEPDTLFAVANGKQVPVLNEDGTQTGNTIEENLALDVKEDGSIAIDNNLHIGDECISFSAASMLFEIIELIDQQEEQPTWKTARIKQATGKETWGSLKAGLTAYLVSSTNIVKQTEIVKFERVVDENNQGTLFVTFQDLPMGGPKYFFVENTGRKSGALAFGARAIAIGDDSFSHGLRPLAYGTASHAEGSQAIAIGTASHAEGIKTRAWSGESHAEGGYTEAGLSEDGSPGAVYAHAEGCYSKARGSSSHAEGVYTLTFGQASHAEGAHTIAAGTNQHAQGKYNIRDDEEKYAHIVGNGTSDSARSNAHTLDWQGNAWYAGDVESATAGKLSEKAPLYTYQTEDLEAGVSPLATGVLCFVYE